MTNLSGISLICVAGDGAGFTSPVCAPANVAVIPSTARLATATITLHVNLFTLPPLLLVLTSLTPNLISFIIGPRGITSEFPQHTTRRCHSRSHARSVRCRLRPVQSYPGDSCSTVRTPVSDVAIHGGMPNHRRRSKIRVVVTCRSEE